ncbi:flagellar basal body-associated FliL family protein [Roseovarius sp. SCSIO 43702]|uniref:flagellar basal body-associated FliL family protein n=1 Tax=Roseovarius sp. SCSIO 43702 TaxID=2823043 RepID=UPI001C7340E7|nr:flagellar basal body-associated FliL family protein [Roseovarius sp. SCSIO 43702]QYX57083.1 flagellar basal body-associated FliL family protein [Roseovarius sp. SCSIO 43702]
MSEDTETGESTPKKSGKRTLLLGLLLGLLGAGGGFYAVHAGLLPGAESSSTAKEEAAHHEEETVLGDLPDVAYVPLAPLVVSLGDGATGKHLRFNAQLEVSPPHREEVEKLMPRVMDVLNGYLRALETSDLTDRSALMKLRAQMLRRIQVVAGGERVRDLLIMEFVLN